VRTDGSYLSGNDPRVLVGLGGATRVKAVRVRWPGGAIEEWNDVKINQYTILKEGVLPQRRNGAEEEYER